MDREAQICAIEKTFEDAKKPIEKHYSKPGVVPVEVLPVFPDFKVYINDTDTKLSKLTILFFEFSIYLLCLP